MGQADGVREQTWSSGMPWARGGGARGGWDSASLFSSGDHGRVTTLGPALAPAPIEKVWAGPSGHGLVSLGGSHQSQRAGQCARHPFLIRAALHPLSAHLSNGIRRHMGQGTIYYSAG